MALLKIIKYDGDASVLAWKHPDDEISAMSELIVNESQEAVLFKGGQACDVFGPGRHRLDSSNLPVLSSLANLPFGGRSPHKVEVWFVNRAKSAAVKWGTSTPMQIQDGKYGVLVPVRAHGSFGLRVEDSKRFLLSMVGTCKTFSTADVGEYFRGIVVSRVKDAISSYLVHEQISLLEINAYLDEISAIIEQNLVSIMAKHGVALTMFSLNSVSVPEDDPSLKSLRDALAQRAVKKIKESDGSSKKKHAKKCPGCDKPMQDEWRFCPFCGVSLSKTCPQCGIALKEKSNFCPECGSELA